MTSLKLYVLILGLLLISFNLMAQNIGITKTEILETHGSPSSIQDLTELNDSFIYRYQVTQKIDNNDVDVELSYVIRDKVDTCYLFQMNYPPNQLKNCIKMLNNKYEYLENNLWYDRKNKEYWSISKSASTVSLSVKNSKNPPSLF